MVIALAIVPMWIEKKKRKSDAIVAFHGYVYEENIFKECSPNAEVLFFILFYFTVSLLENHNFSTLRKYENGHWKMHVSYTCMWEAELAIRVKCGENKTTEEDRNTRYTSVITWSVYFFTLKLISVHFMYLCIVYCILHTHTVRA